MSKLEKTPEFLTKAINDFHVVVKDSSTALNANHSMQPVGI